MYIVDKDAKTVRGHVAQLMTLTKFIFQVVSFAQAVLCIIQLELTSYHAR